jgi:malate dehydrogenase
MKISIIGAGNVGSTTAMRLVQEGAGEIVLVDVVKGLAQGKAFDLEDARPLVKIDYKIEGVADISAIKNSDIIVITAGLPRKPGMTREELLAKNAQILKGICDGVKKTSADAVVIIVTNPLDAMTYFALKTTGMNPKKIFGMGVSLDAARFANLISKELSVAVSEIDACVIGSHGEGMLPLSRFTTVKGAALDELMDDKKIESLVQKTIGRGAEIVSLLGSGSAYYAPSAAITSLVKAIAKDEKRTIGVCAYLKGEYGIKDICIGVPCCIGRSGIEKIIELDLNKQEKEELHKSAESIRKNIGLLEPFL